MTDLSKAKKIHFIGIKGAGMAALAQILSERGISVCGSDSDEEFFTDALLRKRGIPIEQFDAAHIKTGIDAIVYSTGYNIVHPEALAASAQDIPVFSYAQAVAMFFNNAYGIAVCGTHGKTTITALGAWVYSCLGLSPTALFGSTIQGTGTNMYAGASKYWLLEADEYQNKFEHYEPRAIVVGSIDYDHTDFFKTEREYITAFQAFLQKPSCELVIAGIDSAGVRSALESLRQKRIITYGLNASSDYCAANVSESHEGFIFNVLHKGVELGSFQLSLVGRHNIANACAVIALMHAQALVPFDKVISAIYSFPGTSRRFEVLGRRGKTLIVDDYAHHPIEIRATLTGARARYPGKKIVCCFGPHTYTRTQAFFDDFSKSFFDCEQVVVLDIYPSAREKQGTIHSKELAQGISKSSGNALYTGSIEKTIAFLTERIHDIDILITMGAGDVWKVGRALLQAAHE